MILADNTGTRRRPALRGWPWPVLIAAACAAMIGCHHQPVSPELGSLEVGSVPGGAEIIVDGQEIHRATPCKVDGIGAGSHVLTLRLAWYKVLHQAIAIEPGATRHIYPHLAPVRYQNNFAIIYGGRDMAYDQVHQRLYITMLWGNNCMVYDIHDTLLSHAGDIGMDTTQRMIAVSPATNRLFCLQDGGMLAVADLNAMSVVGRLRLPNMDTYQALKPSPDGNLVVASDSVNRRLVVLDARLGALLRYIALPGSPGDFLFDASGARVYVLTPLQRKLILLDFASGAVLAQAPTGRAPSNLFWSTDRSQIGFCDVKDNYITLVNLSNWSTASGIWIMGGSGLFDACATSEPAYLLFLTGTSLNYCYLPTWEMTMMYAAAAGPLSPWNLPGNPIRLYQGTDSRYYYLLCSAGISVIRMDVR